MFNLKSLLHYIKAYISWPVFLVALVITSKTLGLRLFNPDIMYYCILMSITIAMLIHNVKFDIICGIFLIYIPINILITDPPGYFSPWLRFGLFAIVFVAASPLIKSDYGKKLRLRIFRGIIICCIIISVISFFCYFLGINMMKSQWDGSELLDYQSHNSGTFGGITTQSMLLGPISGIAAIACTYLALNRNRKFWILTIMCIGSLFFSASRSSLLATIAGEITLIYFSSRYFGKTAKRIMQVILILAVTYPIWNGALDGLRAKNKGDITAGINLDSRGEKWEIRIEEWKDSPIFGIGFCSVSSRDLVAVGGKIEPGSSWLAILSMTGTVGFIICIIIFLRAAKNSLSPRCPSGAVLGAILIMLGIHMLAEGYIFSGGSFLCFVVWLSIGCATDYAPYTPAKVLKSRKRNESHVFHKLSQSSSGSGSR